MRRGTTPTLILTIKNADLTGSQLEVDMRQGKTVLIKKGDDLHVELSDEDTVVGLFLSQEETLSLCATDLLAIQVRFIDLDGVAGATNIGRVRVEQIIREGVIVYGS